MNKLKKYIIIVLLFIFIIIAILFFYRNIVIKKNNEKYGDVVESELNTDTEISKVSDTEEYYTVKTIVDSYIDNYLEENSEELYGKLDSQYISDYKITKYNVISKLDIIKDYNKDEYEYYKFYLDSMNVSKYKNIETYFINGRIINSNSGVKSDLSIIVEIDKNSYYYILPINYINDKGINIDEGNNYDTHLSSIESTNYNQYELQDVNEYSIILDHMTKLISDMTYDIENSYNTLDYEYKNDKFNTLNDYRNYIMKNFRTILSSSIEKYKINDTGEYKEYICIDQYGNYYIFKDKGVMNYTVMLDTYTIDSDEFNDKYNNGSEQIQVGMNLEKIFQALNRKDYQYIYEKLDNNFKQNYFSTEDKFEEYAKSTFFDINKITYGTFEKQSGMYIYNINISDANEIIDDNEDDEEVETSNISKKFIIKLEDNKNFKLAFNVN